MKKTKKKDDRQYGSFWYCAEAGCEQAGQMNLEQFKAHLKDKHGKEVTKDTKCNKRMDMHIDGADWYSSQYDVDILGLKAVNATCYKRTAEDAAYWNV